MSIKGKARKTAERIDAFVARFGGDPFLRHYLDFDGRGMQFELWMSADRGGEFAVASGYNADGSWTEEKLGFPDMPTARAFVAHIGATTRPMAVKPLAA